MLCDSPSPGVVNEVVVAVEGELAVNTIKTHVLKQQSGVSGISGRTNQFLNYRVLCSLCH